MYVKIGNTKYTKISKLQFEPETDVTGNTIPINELGVSIKTNDSIPLNSRVSLYDDRDNLWAKYWVTYAEKEDAYTVRVRGQSALIRIDSVMLDPVMYSSTSVATALQDVLAPISGEYTLDASFSSATLTGYCPRQSARVRLQWICLVIGAYLKNYFNDRLEIVPMDDDTDTVIPLADTYWKPKVTYKDYVTAVSATYYTYVAGTPSRTEEYVEVDGTYYIQTETRVTLSNNDVPQGARENVFELDKITLINQSNVSSVLSFVAKYKFKRTELDLSAIDNGEYVSGMRVYAFADENTMVEGYINKCSFTFGNQSKAAIHMTPVESKDSATLVITYMWGDKQVGIRVFRFPVGYDYEVENPYIDLTFAGHRYVFRPDDETVSGTMVAAGVTETQSMEIALDLYEGHLHLISVDGVAKTDSTVVIA